MKRIPWIRSLIIGAMVVGVIIGIVTLRAQRGGAGPSQAANLPDEIKVDPMRGPVDMGLYDPALVGAIDVHAHLDPDAPGSGGQVRGLDVFEAAVIAKDRGLRGFVFKTHQDVGSAGYAYLIRKHITPGLQVFGRFAQNMATGGINVAALEHFSQVKGGWGRIVEMPTRDSQYTEGQPDSWPRNRPWMPLMPPDGPKSVPVSKNGELLPEMKFYIQTMARIRTVDSMGPLVLATGHSSPQEHLLLAKEGRSHGLQVLLTHPPYDIPQLPEAARLGAFIEVNASGIYKTQKQAKAAADFIRKIGAEHLIMGTDCGQMGNPIPTDCMALSAQRLRAEGITERQIDLLLKENPAKLLGLAPYTPAVMPRSTQTSPQD